MKFVKTLIESIVLNRRMPKVQVERELGPILEIFIESVMDKLGDNGVIEKGKYTLVAPEFPLQSQKLEQGKQTDRSTNIDYLMVNEDSETLYFVELKTDSTSFKAEQFEIYDAIAKKVEKRGAGHLYSFVKELVKKNKKYKYYDEKIVAPKLTGERWDAIKKVELIYLAPERLSRPNIHRKKGNQQVIDNITFIHFKDLCQNSDIDHEFSEEWKLIAQCLEELDEN